MKIDIYNTSGSKVRDMELPESIYNVPMNEHVLHSVVKAYRANRRQGTHATKTRSMVSGTGKKPFRQKGTGGARQGSTRGPHMKGGAVVHGPQPRSYTQKVNVKTKHLAIKVALSDKVRHGKLKVVDDFSLSAISTKQMSGILKSFNTQSVLFTDERKDNFLYYSSRNLRSASSRMPYELNAEDLLRFDTLIVSENGLKAINQRLGE